MPIIKLILPMIFLLSIFHQSCLKNSSSKLNDAQIENRHQFLYQSYIYKYVSNSNGEYVCQYKVAPNSYNISYTDVKSSNLDQETLNFLKTYSSVRDKKYPYPSYVNTSFNIIYSLSNLKIEDPNTDITVCELAEDEWLLEIPASLFIFKRDLPYKFWKQYDCYQDSTSNSAMKIFYNTKEDLLLARFNDRFCTTPFEPIKNDTLAKLANLPEYKTGFKVLFELKDEDCVLSEDGDQCLLIATGLFTKDKEEEQTYPRICYFKTSINYDSHMDKLREYMDKNKNRH